MPTHAAAALAVALVAAAPAAATTTVTRADDQCVIPRAPKVRRAEGLLMLYRAITDAKLVTDPMLAQIAQWCVDEYRRMLEEGTDPLVQ